MFNKRELLQSLVLLFFVLTCLIPCSAQMTINIEDSEKEDNFKQEVNLEKEAWEAKQSTEDVMRLWFKRKTFLEEGRSDESQGFLQDIKKMSEERVISELEVIGGALLFEAYDLMSAGKYDSALVSFGQALSYDPSLYQAHFGKSLTYFRKNKYNPFPYIVEFLYGTTARFKSFWSLFTTTSNIYIILFSSFVITGFLFALMLGLKYMNTLRHEYQERLPKFFAQQISGAVALGFVLLPLVLWFDVIWLFFFWIIVFWRYFRVIEKTIVAVTMALLLLAVPSLKIIDQLYASTYDDYVKASISAINGTYDLEKLQKINEMLIEKPDDMQLRFIAALLYRNGGYYDQAQIHLEFILANNPKDYKALVNIGNIFYLSQDPYVAIKYYQEAVAVKPDSAKAYFNMSRAFNNAFRFEKAEEMKDKALQLNPDLMSEFLRDESRHVFDEFPDKKTVIGRFISTRDRSFNIKDMFLNSYTMIIISSIVLIFLNIYFSSKFPKASACVKCGRAFCDICKIATESEVYCSQCEHLYLKKDGVSPEIKFRKLYEIERYSKLQTIMKTALNIIFPGSGFAFVNKNLLALPVLWLTSLGMVMLLVQDVLITYSKGIISEIQFPVFWIGIFFILVSWLIANPLSWWKRI